MTVYIYYYSHQTQISSTNLKSLAEDLCKFGLCNNLHYLSDGRRLIYRDLGRGLLLTEAEWKAYEKYVKQYFDKVARKARYQQ